METYRDEFYLKCIQTKFIIGTMYRYNTYALKYYINSIAIDSVTHQIITCILNDAARALDITFLQFVEQMYCPKPEPHHLIHM